MAAPEGTAKNEDQSENLMFDLSNLRNRIRNFIDKQHYDCALFWADKLVSLSDAVEDVFWYAQAMYYTGQYHSAIHLLTSRKLDKTYSACRYLTAKCYYECKEWQEALNILEMADMSFSSIPSVTNSSLNESLQELDANFPIKNYGNSICLLRGKIYEAMDNRSLASDCYREALRLDVYCFEALELLINHHMLTAQEEKDLINSLPLSSQCSPGEADLVRSLYESRMKKYDCPGKVEIPAPLAPLCDNMDVVVSKAERHLYNCNFRTAYKITSRILDMDPYNRQCLPIHIAVLVELKKF
ncbi:unnamed protein product [Candidula unifasciata]|uniref:Cell division cycle protein 16 homolog n=1 Tax=Candidula unifasciata TaxID=100452 RepID=A0A8S3Z9R8_9EUPU|nr:unnamed protein product [Candidula unifasciata]